MKQNKVTYFPLTCNQFHKLSDDWIDGKKISRVDAYRISIHPEQCSKCKEYLELTNKSAELSDRATTLRYGPEFHKRLQDLHEELMLESELDQYSGKKTGKFDKQFDNELTNPDYWNKDKR